MWISQDLDNALRSLIHRLDQEAVLPVFDLSADAAHVAANDGSALPHCFGNGKAKSLPDGFLQHHCGVALQCVHENRIIYCNNNDAFVDQLLNSLEDDSTFGIIARIVAGQNEPAIHLLTRLPEGLNNADRVLPPIKPGYLCHQRAIRRDSMVGQTFLNLLIGHFAVLRGKRIDRRSDKPLINGDTLCIFWQRENRGIVLVDEVAQIAPCRCVR